MLVMTCAHVCINCGCSLQFEFILWFEMMNGYKESVKYGGEKENKCDAKSSMHLNGMNMVEYMIVERVVVEVSYALRHASSSYIIVEHFL